MYFIPMCFYTGINGRQISYVVENIVNAAIDPEIQGLVLKAEQL